MGVEHLQVVQAFRRVVSSFGESFDQLLQVGVAELLWYFQVLIRAREHGAHIVDRAFTRTFLCATAAGAHALRQEEVLILLLAPAFALAVHAARQVAVVSGRNWSRSLQALLPQLVQILDHHLLGLLDPA